MPSRQVIEDARSLVGSTVRGKWRLDALLGVGGSAAVYSATHRNGKRGALKILRGDLADDLDLRSRFLKEGYVANLVGHPGVVAMIDDDIDVEGTPFLVMELLEGSPLDRLVKKGRPMPLARALEIGEAVLDVLAAAHEQGIVHGDIKPGNVFLTTGGEVKVLDFGIAHVSDDTVRMTAEDALGTPAYISPEQARGDDVDGRTDLWALGALMIALISGRRPREGKTVVDELRMAATEPLAPVRQLAPAVSEELAKVLDRAVSFSPRDRWPDATTMQQALRLALLLEQAKSPVEERLDLATPKPGARSGDTRAANERGPRKTTPPPLPPGAPGARGPKPDPLRLLRGRDGSTDTRVATRRVDVSSLGRLSSYPPGSTTTSRIAFASTTDLAAESTSGTVPAKGGKVRSVAQLLALVAAMTAGALYADPMFDASTWSAEAWRAQAGSLLELAGAEPEETLGAGASDAGTPDATRSDASR